MVISTAGWTALEQLARENDWVPAEADGAVAELASHGLAELHRDADQPTAHITITRDGIDALAFRATRGTPDPQWTARRDDGAHEQLELTAGELDLLRDYTRLPPRPDGIDLADAVAQAFHDTARSRWLLQVTGRESAEVGRAVWLDALSGNVAARNRLARVHGVAYPASR